MLYLISGASRSGKSIIARRLLADYKLPYLSLDWLMMGFNDGIPEYGIHHLLWPNEIAEKMWPFFSGMTDNMMSSGLDYVIEGEAMLPELIAELIGKYPGKVKAVFVGYANIDVGEKIALVKKHGDGDDDWLTRESDDYIKEHIENMVAYSEQIRKECETHSLSYFDTSRGFLRVIEETVDYLVADLD